MYILQLSTMTSQEKNLCGDELFNLKHAKLQTVRSGQAGCL